MAKTISSLAVRLAMETDGLTKGAKLSRAEMAEVKKSYIATTTPVQELDAQIKVLGQAFDKGAIPVERYQARLAELRGELNKLKAVDATVLPLPGMKGAAATNQFSGLGRVAGQFGGAMPGAGAVSQLAGAGSMAGPAGIAVAAGLIAITGAMKVATEAASAFTAEMTAQFHTLDQWNMQAEEMGVNVESFATFRAMSDDVRMSTEEIAGAMQKMQQRLGAAAFGGLDAEGGKIGKTLSAIGIDVNDLIAQKPDQQLRTIAEAFTHIKSPTEQAAVAMDLFSREGKKLLPILKQGAAGFDEYTRSSETLREALSKSQNIKDLDQQVDRLGKSYSDLAAVAVTELAPGLTQVAKSLADIGEQQDAINLVVGSMTMLSDAAASLSKNAASVGNAIGWFAPAVKALAAPIPGGGVFSLTVDAAGDAVVAAKAIAAQGAKVREDAKAARVEAEANAPADTARADAAEAQVRRMVEALNDQSEAGKASEKSLENAAKAAQKLSAFTDVAPLLAAIDSAKLARVADDTEKAAKKAEEFAGKLRDQIATWGMVGDAAHIAGMKRELAELQARGATDAHTEALRKQIATVEELASKTDDLRQADEDRKIAMEASNKRVDDAAKFRALADQIERAKALFPQMKFPDDDALKLAQQVEEANKARDRIQELMAGGMISPDAGAAAVAKLQSDLDAAFNKRHEVKADLVMNMQQGSREAEKFLQEAAAAQEAKAFAKQHAAPKIPELQNVPQMPEQKIPEAETFPYRLDEPPPVQTFEYNLDAISNISAAVVRAAEQDATLISRGSIAAQSAIPEATTYAMPSPEWIPPSEPIRNFDGVGTVAGEQPQMFDDSKIVAALGRVSELLTSIKDSQSDLLLETRNADDTVEVEEVTLR